MVLVPRGALNAMLGYIEVTSNAIELGHVGAKCFGDLKAAMLSAALPASVGWQPIETAPRDGTEVLILAGGMAIQAFFLEGAWGPDIPGEVREYHGAVWVAFDDLTQFEVEGGALEGGLDYHGSVTHWMPLPTPPEGEGRAPPPASDLSAGHYGMSDAVQMIEALAARLAALSCANARAKAAEEVLREIVAASRVGSGSVPVSRSARVNYPAALFHRARSLLATMEKAHD
jgi:hypothetical protein